jgi:hypothetical protein
MVEATPGGRQVSQESQTVKPRPACAVSARWRNPTIPALSDCCTNACSPNRTVNSSEVMSTKPMNSPSKPLLRSKSIWLSTAVRQRMTMRILCSGFEWLVLWDQCFRALVTCSAFLDGGVARGVQRAKARQINRQFTRYGLPVTNHETTE